MSETVEEVSTRPIVASVPITIPEGMHPFDWLVSLKPDLYGKSPLCQWEHRYESDFLKAWAELRARFPRYLERQTDYLFGAASRRYGEILTPIHRDGLGVNILGSNIDRKRSMQGGFPWTDENNPWPVFNGVRDDGVAWSHADGTFLQLNMKDIGEKLGIPLPHVLWQRWEDVEREIPLSEIEGKEPTWEWHEFPDSTAFGWDAQDKDVRIGNYIDVNTEEPGFVLPLIQLEPDEAEIDDEYYAYQELADAWSSEECRKYQALSEEEREIVDNDDGPIDEGPYPWINRWDFAEVKGLPKLPDDEQAIFEAMVERCSDLSRQDMEKWHHDGRFLGEPDDGLLGDPYSQWVLSGQKCLYSPDNAENDGLCIWSYGMFVVFYELKEDGTCEFTTRTGR